MPASTTVRALGWELTVQGVAPRSGRSRDAFYRALVMDNNVLINFGRTGSVGQYDVRHFASFEQARTYTLAKVAEKEAKGYRMSVGTTFFEVDAYDAAACGTTNSSRQNGDPAVSQRIVQAWQQVVTAA